MKLKIHDASHRDEKKEQFDAPQLKKKKKKNEDRRLKMVNQWTPPGGRPPPAPKGGVLPC